MTRIAALILAVDRRVTHAAVVAGCLCLCLALAAGLWQVIARFVLFQSAAWSGPAVQVALIWLTYLALAGAMRTGSLIAVDMALRISTPRLRAVLRLFGLITTMGLLLVILWFGAVLVWRVRFQTVAGLDMSASWAYLALPVGAVLSILALVAHTLDPDHPDRAAPDSAG